MNLKTAYFPPPGRERWSKLLLRMRITAFILLVACMQVSAKVASQTVTLSEKGATLQSIFKKINRQTG